MPGLWLKRLRCRHELSALSPEQMRDVGLDPEMVRRESGKPFWEPKKAKRMEPITMASHVFQQVDVFTAVAFKGNPLAVVVGADHLTDQQMAAIANWTNLSETTFLLRPTDAGADYRVRIFTPTRELPFAGHPTLGSCHVWLATGGSPKKDHIVQECGVGLVRIKRDGKRLACSTTLRGVV